MGRRIGIDIGGTFTDITVLDDDGTVRLWKEDSTPDDPSRAIREGLAAAAERLGVASTEALLSDCDLLVHGTTIATNTIIQRNGARVGLICTKGFRDTLYFRDGFKPERFNRHLAHPVEFVERFLRIGVHERINSRGEVVVPLNQEDVKRACETFRDAGVEGVAVALLWSVVNSANERRVGELVKEHMPDVPVLLSSDVLPEIREWERTSATVLSTYVLSRMARYMRDFEAFVQEQSLPGRPLIMQINGGCASVDHVLARPVYAINSGPAAAPAAANYFGAKSPSKNFISIDMGGTSFDVCLLREGAAVTSRDMMVGDAPIGVRGVETHSIGAGGGSIAWVDPGGALRVGPQSAGARPGPACYGQGGEEPTVTDANLLLGYLDEGAFLGGRRTLQKALSAKSVEKRVAAPLGLDTETAAAGIYRAVNANMVDAIRAVSVQRGIDPRGFALVSGGGAGGIHVGRLGAQLGISQVVIPAEAGLYCAFGMTVTDVRHDLSRHVEVVTSSTSTDEIEAIFGDLEAQVQETLVGDGFEDDRIRILRSIDARYPNQVHELTVDVPSDFESRPDGIREIEDAFHEQHERLFKYSMRSLPVQVLHWRVAGIGSSPSPPGSESELAESSEKPPEPASERPVFMHEVSDFVLTPIYKSAGLEPGMLVDGPAVVEGESTTIVVFPGQSLRADARAHTLTILQPDHGDDAAPLGRTGRFVRDT